MKYPTFKQAIADVQVRLRTAPIVHAERWQGKDVRSKPEMATHELLNYSFTVEPFPGISLEALVDDIKPDLPWADDHFAERVSGQPLNPPPSEEWWPHAPQGNRAWMDSHGAFSHTYPERYWPRFAGYYDGGKAAPRGKSLHPDLKMDLSRFGIRFNYGDLNDLVSMLVAVPHTRQAYLPVWFPEDLGAPLDARRPCTLGYHFIRREDRLHIVYYIRSCDYLRHFRNDIYMTVRLQRWVIEQCLKQKPEDWDTVYQGTFTMHITSMHLFRHDYRRVYG